MVDAGAARIQEYLAAAKEEERIKREKEQQAQLEAEEK